MRRTAPLAVALLAVSWSAPLVRLAVGAPALAIGFWRTAISTAVFAPVVLTRHRSEVRRLGRRALFLLLASGAALAVHFAAWIASIGLTTVASSVLLVSSQPVFVALGSALMGEPLTRAGWAGIALAMIGAALVAGGDAGRGSRPLVGAMLALLGAVAAAAYFLAGRRLRREVSAITYSTAVYGVAAVILGTALAVARLPAAGYRPGTWLAILAIALGPQILGHTILNQLLGQVGATKLSVAILVEPVGAALIAAVLFGERPPLLVLPGGAAVLAGIWIVMACEAVPTMPP